MVEEPGWAAYFYPGSDIFRNKLDLHDDRLWEAERFLGARRAEQIRVGIIPIPRTGDLEQFKAIHRALFGDVYDWAGELRTVTIGKRVEEGEPARWFIGPDQIEPWFEAVAGHISDRPWTTMSRNDLVGEIADVATMVNFSHPMRDGSGRTGRIFLEQLIEGSRYRLDFNAVEAHTWNTASRDSIRPGRTSHPDGPLLFEPMRIVFQNIVVDNPTPQPPSTVLGLGPLAAAREQRLGYTRIQPAAPTMSTPPSVELDR